jgi:hypothetical protein
MGRALLTWGESYDPDTLKVLTRAYDAAWRDISKDGAGVGAEDRRTCLALIILAFARDGLRDEREIKQLAVRYMSSKELPPSHATKHQLLQHSETLRDYWSFD